jgi:hypothetical protein
MRQVLYFCSRVSGIQIGTSGLKPEHSHSSQQKA